MKFITLSIIIIGTLLLLNLGGAAVTPITGFVRLLYSDVSAESSPLTNLSNTSIWLALLFAAGLVGAIGVKAGFYGSAPPISYYLGGFAVLTLGGMVLVDLSALIITLWQMGESWIRAITLLIFIPLSFIYIAALKSYWEGSD
jgi:hypothetical protein